MNIDFQSVKLFLRYILQQIQIFHHGPSQAILKPILKVLSYTSKININFEIMKTIIIRKSAIKTFSTIGKIRKFRIIVIFREK